MSESETGRPLPKNLRRIYALIGEESAGRMMEGAEFTVEGVQFVSGYRPESTPDRFFIAKPPDLLEQYEDFIDEVDPARVFELGIAEGGSTALLALRPGIEQLVAIDNEEHRLPALDEFVEARGLSERVHAYYDTDQADAAALIELVRRHFSDRTIDLVIDDASHDYELTLASFNCLFPEVAVGGWYLIEDWAQDLKVAEAVCRAHAQQGKEPPPPQPLTNQRRRMDRLVVELTMAMGAWPGAVDRVVVTDHFIAARRGSDDLTTGSFALEQLTIAAQSLGIVSPPES